MSQSKNEIPALVVALGVTAALIGGGIWWLMNSDLLSKGAKGPSNVTATADPNSPDSPNQSAAAIASAGNTFSDVAEVPSGRFTYGGSTTWASIRGAVDPALESALPNFKLIYQDATGSGDGIQKLIAGDLDFAQSSRPLNPDEKQQAEQQGFSLQEIPVATEAIAIATHPDITLSGLAHPGLTLTQLKDIYTGKITNWSQVGGPNLAIVPASRGETGGTVQFFQEAVMANQPFANNVQRLASTTEALRFVSTTPGAIYFASAPEVVGQCTVVPVALGTSEQNFTAPYQQPYVAPQDCPVRRNQLNLSAFQTKAYPLTRPLYVIVRQDNQPAQQAGIAYAKLLKTQQGQGLLQQAGFVPLQ
ncbi:MAG: phosphate ABC transporter substrate-binding protein [Phormidesmis priestleyi]|uniref:Phosphate ABC transporter substrate-binding protein n=1 Tax=Phormidesmis priestleyi TaxID=268141 RepID=A0A2W4ZKE1_9CYAN|nr:MAG: phosphate ABC transporter substrate-binding protein [Phormidesmis priestleyi]